MFTIQVRKPGRRYETVGRDSETQGAAWVLQQWLVPGSRNTVRVVDETTGKTICKATPRTNGAK